MYETINVCSITSSKNFLETKKSPHFFFEKKKKKKKSSSINMMDIINPHHHGWKMEGHQYMI
jgi:hypothetical protein